jgi:hypothetical protein
MTRACNDSRRRPPDFTDTRKVGITRRIDAIASPRRGTSPAAAVVARGPQLSSEGTAPCVCAARSRTVDRASSEGAYFA